MAEPQTPQQPEDDLDDAVVPSEPIDLERPVEPGDANGQPT